MDGCSQKQPLTPEMKQRRAKLTTHFNPVLRKRRTLLSFADTSSCTGSCFSTSFITRSHTILALRTNNKMTVECGEPGLNLIGQLANCSFRVIYRIVTHTFCVFSILAAKPRTKCRPSINMVYKLSIMSILILQSMLQIRKQKMKTFIFVQMY